MKKWSRLTALVLAFAIVLSTVSGALAQIEIDHDDFQTWVADTKEAEGLSGVISIDQGGEVLVEPSTFTGELNQGPLYTSETSKNLNTYAQGSAPTVDVQLGQYGKVDLVAPSAGKWQVYLSAADLWVNITGETGSTFALTYAKVKGMIDADGAAKIRCLMGESVTETVNVHVSYEASAIVVNAAPVVSQPMVMSARAVAADAQAEGDPENKSYDVVVNYVFEDGKIVADPYTANLAAGSNFSAVVTFPEIQGYLAYLGEATEATKKLDLNITNIQAGITYTVTYKPTNVNYTVIHYQQNVDNDKYTIVETETKQGLTKSIVPEVAKTYEGFYALIYERPEIAADGSTVVEVYYDRNYYLMNFNLDGGYGVEPIYARYGTPLGTIATPVRAGYTFTGWTLDDAAATILQTMPAKNLTYKAVWKADSTAKVTIVFWGENANDENYSYLSTSEIELPPDTQYTYGGATLICTQEAHKHVDECLSCTEKGHTHSASCYTLTCTESHTHGTGCYSGVGSAVSDPSGSQPSSPEEGQVYVNRYNNSDRYIYIAGSWYRYTGSTSGGQVAPTTCTPHVHSDYTGKCYTLTCDEHVHTSGCYKCGKTEHRHNADCFTNDPAYPVASERYLWTFAGSDVVTVAADGSTVVNVYYDRTEFTLTFRRNSSTVKTIKEKWGADIHSNFPIKDGSNTIWWSVPNGTTSMKPGTEFGSLDTMPAENITFTYDSQTSAAVLHYYVEVLDGEAWTYEHAGKHFKLYKDINVTNSWGYDLTYTEEFHDITGFKQYWSDPAFDKLEQGGTTDGINSENWLCYTRNGFDIVYFNPTTQLKTDENVPYEKPLATYYWEPTVDKAPAQYEPGSVKFDGWYLNPECTGEKFDFTKQTMPAGPNNEDGEVALSLYAKWVPVTLTVEFYLDKTAYTAGTQLSTHPTVTVPHGSLVTPKPEDPNNGGYSFIAWFYEENGVEKAYDFANMPVKKNLKVYGKWSSNVLKEYVVLYKIQGTDTEIADPTTGSLKAGYSKTFDAKGGEELYAKYSEGYFPVTTSHTMVLDINTPTAVKEGWIEIKNEDGTTKIVQSYTFEYVQKDAVPYTVYYVAETLKDGGTSSGTITRDGKTYYIIAETYTNSQNRKAVVTEKFKQVSGYMPDAYQKRLVVDGNDGAVNEIIFYYSVDSAHAYYKITHYTQNTDGENWTEYASSEVVGEIGKTYKAEPLTINGFTYNPNVEGTVVSGVLTANGLELKLYYTRNSYPYEIRYHEQGTGKQLADPKKGTDFYGKVISESAIDIPGYTAVDPTSDTLTIKIEESQTEAKLNIITFYYVEKKATINYEPVGPAGATNFGSVNPTTETVAMKTGTATGSTATAGAGYKFVGWYDELGKQVSTVAKYVPTKGEDALWPETSTYYAKFEELTATITYVPVGPDGATDFGSVDPTTETVAMKTGSATGSTATAGTGYEFVGWYSDPSCEEDYKIADTAEFKPTKPTNDTADTSDDLWANATYYAKFVEKQVTIEYKPVFEGKVLTDAQREIIGNVDPYSETIDMVTGEADGSKATAVSNTYKFVGWYTDEACTKFVSDAAEFVPAQPGSETEDTSDDDLWVAATYYAKFDWNVSTLTISKTIEKANEDLSADIDNTAEFTFTVKLNKGNYNYTKTSAAGDKTTGTLQIGDSGEGTVTLKNNETIVIEGVVITSSYEVIEHEKAYYKLDNGTGKTSGTEGTIQPLGASIAQFVNDYTKYKTGSLTLTKQFQDASFTEETKSVTLLLKLKSDPNNPLDPDLEKQFEEWATTAGNTNGWNGNTKEASIVITVAASAENKTNSVTLNNLPVADYVVTEMATMPEYNVVYEPEDGCATVTAASTSVPEVKVTNTITGKRDIVVNKKWEDLDNKYGVRPEMIQLTLLANGEKATSKAQGFVNPAQVTGTGNQWQVTFAGLDTFDTQGNFIVYTVDELAVDELEMTEYAVTNTESIVDLSKNELTITNTLQRADLTISKTGLNAFVYKSGGDHESALFKVEATDKTKDDREWTVAINGNSSVTIKGVKIGVQYKVTELNDWTWRYDENTSQTTDPITADGASVKFENTLDTTQWLNGDNYKVNVFGPSND